MNKLTIGALCDRVRTKFLPIVAHSKKVTPGAIFVGIPPATPFGTKTRMDPAHIVEAIERGASFFVVEPEQGTFLSTYPALPSAVSVIVVESTRVALGKLASAAFATDRGNVKIVGITGTNGKTTESYLLEHLFQQAGFLVGVMGTVTYRWPGYEADAALTTPGCLEIHENLAQMEKAGVQYVFMEVSSHALDQERVAGVVFSGALLTNVTQDHLDYHPDMEHYFLVKERLFREDVALGFPRYNKVRCCNMDDPYAKRILQKYPAAIGFGLDACKEFKNDSLIGTILSMNPQGMSLEMAFQGKKWQLTSPLVGKFNALNLLGAQAVGLSLGLTIKDLQCLSSYAGVPGRLERVPNNKGVNVFVDYAHTPDALENVLTTLRTAGFSRVITVFGCGGDRDSSKRPLMGKIAAEYSDVVVLTSDNPRTEDPETIMRDIMPGLSGCKLVVEEPDRKKALERSLAFVGENDALLVAGKGHETYQIIGKTKFPFSDHAVLKELLA